MTRHLLTAAIGGLLVSATLPAFAMPPKSCAAKFVGTWSYSGGTTVVNADGTANPQCFLCVPVQTWTCNGNTYIITGPTTYQATLTPDGRQMVGSAGVATRVSGGERPAARPAAQPRPRPARPQPSAPVEAGAPARPGDAVPMRQSGGN